MSLFKTAVCIHLSRILCCTTPKMVQKVRNYLMFVKKNQLDFGACFSNIGLEEKDDHLKSHQNPQQNNSISKALLSKFQRTQDTGIVGSQ